MKSLLTRLSFFGFALLLSSFAFAQEDWPKVVTASDGTVIKVYQPQPENFKGNQLQFRSAISVTATGNADPIFGTFWATSKVETDRDNRDVSINTLNITSIKIPAIADQDRIDFIDDALESQFPQAAGSIPQDELLTSLDQNAEQEKLAQSISTKPPKILFTTQPSMLVLIDGEPKLQRNPDWNLDAVVNSPFTIVKNTDGRFFLYGSKHWYVANLATGPYSFTGDNVPDNIRNIGQVLDSKASTNSTANNGQNAPAPAITADPNAIASIVVSTVPAELIQSKGEPNFTPVEGTSLLYIKNSDNDIFMDVNSQAYFVLISGRWYQTKKLTSNDWAYIAADQLPQDFTKIPPGSPKDNVLASVAGTDQARDAVMDAEIPQTAKIDRHSATTNVVYNGQPKFTDIDGTDLQEAVNTSSTVLRTADGRFYTVDNGVWFVSPNATGPWTVSTDRPDQVNRIPPSNPAYNTKYVNVYDVNDDYVYMGYTPGYLNSYVYGPTVVYGTGYYYNPWYDGYYYARPWSWGFGFGYTPFYGWGFGFGYNAGWFNVGYGWGGWGGGWWGPGIYHPAYWGGYHGGNRPYGFYGNNGFRNGYRPSYNNNIYRNRGGIVTRNARPAAGFNRPGGMNRPNDARPGGGNFNGNRPNNAGRPGNGNIGTRPNGFNNGGVSRPSSNNVFSDRQGNVYQRGQQGQWQQRQSRSWSPANNARPEVIQNLNRDQSMRDRGQSRMQNFQRAQSAPSRPSFGGGGGGSRPSGGGGARPSGGGGGGSRSGGGHR